MTEIYLTIGLIIAVGFGIILTLANRRFGLETIIFMVVALFAWPIALILAFTRSEDG
jgi:hypothetical protein